MLIVVSLLISISSYCQSFERVVVATKSIWYNDEWKTISTEYPKDMFVIIKDWDITIGTYKFRTFDNSEKTTYPTHVCYSWKCVNGDGIKCIFMMKKFNPDVSTHMLYSIVYDTGVMYEYETE